MIDYVCKQCGRAQRRPDSDSGTVVFCECGHGNLVPWHDAPAPAEPGEDADVPLANLVEEQPTQHGAGAPQAADQGDPEAETCFNHDGQPAQVTCADCGVGFCENCVVSWEGEPLCGPCKNLRLRRFQKPPRTSVPAVVSIILSMCGGPISLCTLGAAAQASDSGIGFAGLIVPVAGLVLGLIALWQIEGDPQLGGRALAITGVVIGIMATTMGVILAVLTGQS